MELEKLNCPGCGGPVKAPANRTPFHCEHCGSALVIREEAGVSLLALSDKLSSMIAGGNQEIISVIQKTSRASADARLYQSQIEQELSALSVQLVPLKSEFSTLSAAKKEANIVRRIQTISIQIYMLLERTRLLKHKLYETYEGQKSPLDQLHEQYTYIQSEFGYLAHAGDSPDVRQFRANLSAQHNDVENQMVEIIRGTLRSSSFSPSPENDIQVLLDQRKVLQGDIRTVSALAVTSATQKIVLNLRAKEQELNKRIWKIQSEASQAERQKQLEMKRAERQKHLEAKLVDFRRQKDEILKQRKLTGWDSVAFAIVEQSIRYLGLSINFLLLKYMLGMLLWSLLAVLLMIVGIHVVFTLIVSILLFLVLSNRERIGNFFTGTKRQWKEYRDRNQIAKDSALARTLEIEQEEGPGLDESETRIEPPVETSINSESSIDVGVEPSLTNVEALPLLESAPIENATPAELSEQVTAPYETSAEPETSEETDKKPVLPDAADSPLLQAEQPKRKFPAKKLALITITILTFGISGFCVLAGLVWAAQSTLAGVSAFLFGLLCLGLAGLAIANLKATSSSSTRQLSEKNILYTIYSHQKPIGFVVGLGLMLTCIGTFAAIATSDPATAKAAATPLNVSNLQTAAFETAMMGIYQTTTANAPTATSTLPAAIPSVATSAAVEGTIIQDLSKMRSFPSLDAPILTTLAMNTNVSAIASSSDKLWFLVNAENGRQGWIHNSLAQFSASLENLPVSTDTIPTSTTADSP